MGHALTSPDCSPLAYDSDRHLGFIVSTWLHTYRQSPEARLVHPATYTQSRRAVIDGLLARRSPDILTTADGTIIAWSLWEQRSGERRDLGNGRERVTVHGQGILHYVWVAQPIRRCGFASRILREHGADRNTVVSHWSDAAQRAFDESSKIRQLFCATNSHHPRFSPTLCANPNAFVAM